MDFDVWEKKYLDPAFQKGQEGKVFSELAEQIYAFRLFTPNFCDELIQAMEANGKWISEMEMSQYSPIHPNNPFLPKKKIPSTLQLRNDFLAEFFNIEVEDPEFLTNKAFPLCHLPDLNHFFAEVAIRYLIPAFKKIWSVYEGLFFEQPYAIQYDDKGKRSMRLHADHETMALVIYLNDSFEGGGTIFPRWNLNLGKRPTGSAIIYPGGISHIHGAAPITSGKRYILRAGFF